MKHKTMKARTITVFLIAIIASAICAGFISANRTANAADKTFENSAKEIELGKLYRAEVALRILKNIRVLSLLNSNDVVNAKAILYQDLESNASSLSALRHEFKLSEQETQALKAAEQFVQSNKKK